MSVMAPPDISINENFQAFKGSMEKFRHERAIFSNNREALGKSIIGILDCLPGVELPAEVDTLKFLIKEGHVKPEKNSVHMQLLPDDSGDRLEVEVGDIQGKEIKLKFRRVYGKYGSETSFRFTLLTNKLEIKDAEFSFEHQSEIGKQFSGFKLDDKNCVESYTGLDMPVLRNIAPEGSKVNVGKLIAAITGKYSLYQESIIEDLIPSATGRSI